MQPIGTTRTDYFDIKYTAGRRKKKEGGYEAKAARGFFAVVG